MSTNENDASPYVDISKCTRWRILAVVVAILLLRGLLQTNYEIHIDKRAYALSSGPRDAVGYLEPEIHIDKRAYALSSGPRDAVGYLEPDKTRTSTAIPTSQATNVPVPIPSLNPSPIPTFDKTRTPTAIPTPQATNVPVPIPSLNPSPIPTFGECPLTDDFDHDFALEVFTEVFDKLNRPWFGFGGFVLNLLRVGSIKLKIGNKKYHDTDMDIGVIVNDSKDRKQVYTDIKGLCKNRTHLRFKTNSAGTWSQIYLKALDFHFTIAWAVKEMMLCRWV